MPTGHLELSANGGLTNSQIIADTIYLSPNESTKPTSSAKQKSRNIQLVEWSKKALWSRASKGRGCKWPVAGLGHWGYQ